MSKKLTAKQLKLQQIKSENPTISTAKAMRLAGYSDYTARGGKRNLSKSMHMELSKVMDKIGLTSNKIAKKINEGTDAVKTVYFQKDGKVLSQKNDIDFLTREKYLKLICEIRGDIIKKVQGEFTMPDIDIRNDAELEQVRRDVKFIKNHFKKKQ